jgi:ribosomal protein L11 methyltransferase
LNQVRGIKIIEGEISKTNEAFDVIAANLISGVLINLAPAIASRLNPKGIAILSGILKGQEDEVIAAMETAGLVFHEKLVDGKWVSIVTARD